MHKYKKFKDPDSNETHIHCRSNEFSIFSRYSMGRDSRRHGADGQAEIDEIILFELTFFRIKAF
jgi:hypothetical protein